MTQVIRSLRSGQITIPVSFRQKLGIEPDGLLQIMLTGEELRIRPVRISDRAAGSAWFKELYDHFGKVRQEARKYSEKAVDKTVDQAVKAVRAKND